MRTASNQGSMSVRHRVASESTRKHSKDRVIPCRKCGKEWKRTPAEIKQYQRACFVCRSEHERVKYITRKKEQRANKLRVSNGVLPDPKDCTHGMGSGHRCNYNPELRAWLDELKAIRDSGGSLKSHAQLCDIAGKAGFSIGRETVGRHLRGECTCVPKPQ